MLSINESSVFSKVPMGDHGHFLGWHSISTEGVPSFMEVNRDGFGDFILEAAFEYQQSLPVKAKGEGNWVLLNASGHTEAELAPSIEALRSGKYGLYALQVELMSLDQN